MKTPLILKISLMVLTMNAVACSYHNGSDPMTGSGSSSGYRKVDMSTTSTSAVAGEPITKGILLTGTQVNVNMQIARSGATFMGYFCDVRGFSRRPLLRLTSRDAEIDLVDATQVNCFFSAPINTDITVQDAGQTNLHAILGGQNIVIRNSRQVNITVAIRTGVQYNFDIQGLQLNNLGSCAPFATTSATAPRVTVQSAVQANVTCISEEQANWLAAGLADLDAIPVKSIDGQLLF